MAAPIRAYPAVVAAASLVLGPLLMSIGDLLHPEEKLEAADQAAIIVDEASRWYAAHLLLFFGMLILIPGLLALANLASQRHAIAGYAARNLLMIGAAAFSAVFVSEMLVGRFVSDGATAEAAADLLKTFQSGWILGAVLVGGIAFFVGVAAVAGPLILANDGLRSPAVIYVIGVILIAIEIASAEVLFSQAGNIALLVASWWVAWRIIRGGEQLVVSAVS